MKTLRFLTTLILLGTLGFSSAASAGYADVIALAELRDNLSYTSRTYRYEKGWYVHDFEPVFISTGDSHNFTIHLNAGDSMVFRGMGDDDAIDIDLRVSGPGGFYRTDTDYDASPLVTFRAPRTGTYRINMRLISCRANGSYCALLVAEK